MTAVLVCSCGKRLNTQVRDAVRNFDNLSLPKESVEVTDVRGSGDKVVAEITVKTAIKMTRRNNKWELEEVRLGDRRWEKASHILTVLEGERIATTREQLKKILAGIHRYQGSQGEVPAAANFEKLIDTLSPTYLKPVIRIDAWSNRFFYRTTAEGGYDLRSAGPDGAVGTGDDLIAESP